MNRQVIKNRIRKFLAYLFTATLFLLISGFLVLQMPPVQNWFAQRFLKGFTKVVGFNTTLKGFRMLWFDRLELTGVSVYDLEGNRMIGAKEILINFQLSQLLEKNNINIDGIFIDSAHVYITKINENDTARNLNINVFIDRINEGYGGSSGKGKPPRINIGEAFLNQSQFTYLNQDADSIKNAFDYNHFSVAVDEGNLRSFVVLGDTTEFFVRTLIAHDLKTKFNVKQLSTFFRLSQRAIEFSGLDLHAGESVISDTVIFYYDGQRELNDFVNKVKIHAMLRKTIIDPRDLNLFAPGVNRITQPLTLSGEFNGKINKFKFIDMQLGIGSTNLYGALDMEGLPNFNETFINLNVRNSIFNPEDFSFLFNNQTLFRLRPLGTLAMHGQFLGYPNDFVATGSFDGKLGQIKSDINFKVNDENIDYSVYKGKLSLTSFDLGRYLNDTSFYQQVTLSGSVSGRGITQTTADFELNGKIRSIGIKGYNYTNITTDARFATGLFRGLVKINDPNLEFTARGSVDLRNARNEIRLQAQLDTAYLHKLNFSNDSVFIHATIDADLQGLSLDSLKGTATIKDIIVLYKDEYLRMDRISVYAQHDAGNRHFKVESKLIDAEAKGNYFFSEISNDIQTLAQEIALNVKNNKQEIANYYAQKTRKPKPYEANIVINLKDIKPITNLLDVDLQIGSNIKVDGRFSSGRTSIFNLYSELDSLTLQGKLFTNSNAELTVSKISDSTSVLAMLTINSARQAIDKNLITKNLLAEAIWNKTHIDFSVDAEHEGKTNYVRVKGDVNFLQDSTVVTLHPSDLKLLERNWHFAQNNFISIRESDLTFHNFAIQHDEQAVTLHGQVSHDPTKVITLDIDSLDLSLFNVLTNVKIAGKADAQIALSNYYRKPTIENDIRIADLTMNDFLIGEVTGNNHWDTLEKKLNLDIFIDRLGKRIVNLRGDYDAARKGSPISLYANLNKAELKIAEPFLEDIFSHINGTISGNFSITGTLQTPIITGRGEITDGRIMINYLKTLYQFTGIVGLTPNTIDFNDIVLQDVLRNKADLQATITHKGFSSMSIMMNTEFRNFQVLNTDRNDNSLFYGQASATGNVNISGPLNNLRISATASTDKNTRIYIPLSSSSSIDKKEFIMFVNFKDTTFTKKVQRDITKKVNITGLTFELNLAVTPDAYCEIIFDQKAGDIILGRGNGDLRLYLDTKGEFSMIGPFEFTEGKYNFTLYDIINKEFIINKGSRITWLGDPYQATVDIKATYNQLASFAPIVNRPSATASPQLQRKYPAQVLLTLSGPMLSPDINFDITAKDLPKNINTQEGGVVNLDLEFTAFKNKLDEQELKRQVFSLIVLRRFSPPESLDATGSVVSSLSELFSNQLSHWMSQVDEDLVFDVDIGSMDQESFNTFQFRMSYTFLNGRMRVTGDGTYNSSNSASTPSGTRQNPSSVAGDWSVDYMLTADGKLRVKMYSRTNVNPISTTVNQQTAITSGASLIHTQSFNELRELWMSARKKQQRQEEERAKFNEDILKPDDDTE